MNIIEVVVFLDAIVVHCGRRGRSVGHCLLERWDGHLGQRLVQLDHVLLVAQVHCRCTQPRQTALTVVAIAVGVVQADLALVHQVLALVLLHFEERLARLLRGRLKFLHGLGDAHVDSIAATLLMLRHVPLGDVPLAAALAKERSHALVLAQVHLEVTARVIPFITTWKVAIKLVHILMGLLVIAQDPQLSVRMSTARVAAAELVDSVLPMCCQMILQMLRHLERFLAARESTLVEAYLQVRLEMLLLFGVFREHFSAAMNRTVNVVAALLCVVVEDAEILKQVTRALFGYTLGLDELLALLKLAGDLDSNQVELLGLTGALRQLAVKDKLYLLMRSFEQFNCEASFFGREARIDGRDLFQQQILQVTL